MLLAPVTSGAANSAVQPVSTQVSPFDIRSDPSVSAVSAGADGRPDPSERKKEDAEKPSALSLGAGIDFRLVEKAWLLLDFLQILGLIWVTSQAWPWPHIWLRWIRWVVWANLDYFSTTPDGALNGRNAMLFVSKWGSMKNYATYALAFSSIATLLFIFYLIASHLRPQHVHHFKATALFAGHVVYLPIALAVFRLYHCNSDGTLSADPSVECGSLTYLATVAIATALACPVLVGLPLYCRRVISRDCVIYHRSASDHEKFMQACEIARGLGLREVWLPRQMWLCASCTLQGSHFHNAVIACKMAILFCFTFLRQNIIAQACTCFAISIVAFAAAVIQVPFRVPTTNMMLFALLTLMVCYTSFGMINALGVRSSATVDSSESIVLAVLSAIAAIVSAYATLLSARSGTTEWPSKHTLWRIKHSSMRNAVQNWIETIRYANETRYSYARSAVPRAFVSARALDRAIQRLRVSWTSARSLGSIFEVIIGDVLDLMLLFRQRVTESSIRHSHKPLDSALYDGAYQALQRRERARALMPSMKRRFLTKMTSLRAFLGDRRLNSVRLADGTLLDEGSEARVSLLKDEVIPQSMGAQEELMVDPEIGPWGQDNRNFIYKTSERILSDSELPQFLLQQLPGKREWSETFLKAARSPAFDPSTSDLDGLLEIIRFWSDLVDAIADGRIREADLKALGSDSGGRPLLVEDCYSYFHMLSDASERFELNDLFGDDAEIDQNANGISRSFGYDL